DEPTAALEKREIERLFAVLARMKARGTAIIYISHQLDEVVAIADRCTVLRDGRVAAVSARGAFSVHDLVIAMTGRAAEEVVTAPVPPGDLLLAAQLPHPDPPPQGGEEREGVVLGAPARGVLGLAGLLGSGTEGMIRRLFGAAGEPTTIEVGGRPRRFRHPADAIAAGVGMVPPERALGLIMSQSVRDNILLPNLDAFSRNGVVDRAAGDRIVAELMALLDIRPRRPQLKAAALSGGNQQKVILAKWLARRIAVLLLDEPTQGIDVAAKVQIHELIRDFVTRAGAALVNSSDRGALPRLRDPVPARGPGPLAPPLELRAG